MHIRLKPLAALLLPLSTLNTQVWAQQSFDPVVVTATRSESRVSEVLADVTVIDRAEIERHGAGTITELLARQPGIQAVQNGGPGTSTSFYIRGTNAAHTKVLVDGVAINSVDLSGSPLRFISLADVERIEILRGPGSTLYGADAVGGVIHVITRRGAPGLRADGFVGYGSKNTRQASAGLSGGNEQWRFRIEADQRTSDGFSSQRKASNRDADADAYRNTGGAASLSFMPVAGHEIGAAYRRNEGRVHYDSGNQPADGNYDDRVDFTAEQWQVFSRNRLTEHWVSRLQYAESEDRQTSWRWDAWAWPVPLEEKTQQDTRNRQMSWQNDVTLPLGKALFALERHEQEIRPVTGFMRRPEIDNNSALLGWTASAGDHSWQLNARRDEHSEFGGQNTWGAAYGYRLSQALRAHVSYGTAFKAPSVYQLFMNSPWGSGNPDLKPEKSRNQELGLAWDNGTHTVNATWYRNRITNLIDWVSDPVTWVGTYENVSKARLEGVTVTYAGRFGEWNIKASYDWLDAENADNHKALGRRAKHRGMVGVSRTWGAFEAGVEALGVGKRYNSNDETGEMGGYGLVNLTGRYAINKSLSIEGRINNLFDKNYELAQGYNTPGMNAFIGIRYTPQ